MTPDEIAQDRRGSYPARAPYTWVVGRVPDEVLQYDTECPLDDGTSMRVRVSRPRGAARSTSVPCVVYFHGGGWTRSNPWSYDSLTGLLAHELGAVVVAPDYRKAPQHKAPTAVEDAWHTLQWVMDKPEAVGGHDGRLAVAGDSAGGNLAALVSLRSRDEGTPEVLGQALLYPATDLSRSHPSSQWRDELVLPGESMDAFLAHYLDDSGVDARDPRVSPEFASDHRGLAPALIQTAEADPLVDEGQHYARLLADADTPVRHTCYVGMPHGFMSMPGVVPVGAQARAELVEHLRGCLAV